MKLLYGCRKDGYWPLSQQNIDNIGLTLNQVLSSVPTKVIILGQDYKTVWMTLLALGYLRRNFWELK